MLAFLVACAMSAVGVIAMATPALAYANRCTPAPYGYVCNTTYGNGAYVPQVTAVRGKASGDLICNYSADISVLDGRNQSRVKYYKHFSYGGCSVGRAWFNAYPVRTFACGDVVSVAWFEDGKREGGYANVRLC